MKTDPETSMTDCSKQRQYNFLSLGAGVQSSTLALKASLGELGVIPDAAIFADTQAEPDSVYDWLDWLEKELKFPVYRVTAGSLTEESLRIRHIKKQDAKLPIGTPYLKKLIPVFGISPDGSRSAAIGRRCTVDFKIVPVLRKVKELVRAGGVKPRDADVVQWIGISYDEVHRIKPPREPWITHRYPLIEERMTRKECIEWCLSMGYPSPPRSACVYCPFHSDDEWRRLKGTDPSGWKKAVEFDRELRKRFKEEDESLHIEVYLHDSCVPLDEVDFTKTRTQPEFDFASECTGMCGV